MSQFAESLERVKNGTASCEEAASVHEEIAKYEAIAGYLEEQVEQVLPLAAAGGDGRTARRIARKVRLRLFCTVLLTLLALLLAAGLAVVGCNRFYYNPNQGTAPVYGGDGQLMLDLYAFNKLHSPGYTTSWAEAWRDGPGSYQLRIHQANLFQGTQQIVAERVVRGKLLGNDGYPPHAYWHNPPVNAFGYREGSIVRMDGRGGGQRVPDAADLEWQREALRQLPASCRAAVYVTLPNDLPLEEFAGLYSRWGEQLDFLYAAVAGSGGYIGTTVGFSLYNPGILLENTPGNAPYFQLVGFEGTPPDEMAAVWAQHFRSLVGYLSQRPQFLQAMAAVNTITPAYYQDVLDYIDENGMWVYGVLISGEQQNVLTFLDEVRPLDFFVGDVRLSVLSNG